MDPTQSIWTEKYRPKTFSEFKGQENPPAELKPFNDRLEAMMGKMMGTMGKIAPFMSDPKVVAAQERYTKVMGDMK